MSTSEEVSDIDPSKQTSRGSVAVLATITILFVAWILSNYDRNIHPLSYVTTIATWLIANLSMFRVTLIVGLGGSLLSIPVVRRRSHYAPVPAKPSIPHFASQPADTHPMLMIPRPSRDPKFIVRKTKNRGRISRNREGQRLPATPPYKEESNLD